MSTIGEAPSRPSVVLCWLCGATDSLTTWRGRGHVCHACKLKLDDLDIPNVSDLTTRLTCACSLRQPVCREGRRIHVEMRRVTAEGWAATDSEQRQASFRRAVVLVGEYQAHCAAQLVPTRTVQEQAS